LVVTGFTADAVEPGTTNPRPYSSKLGSRFDDRGIRGHQRAFALLPGAR
jgi:hypothetical protein